MPIWFNKHNPQTLEEAVEVIVESLNKDEIEYIRSQGTALLHLTVGMQMRNDWGLWHDSPLAVHIKERFQLGHADDMSGLVFEGITAAVLGRQPRYNAKAEHYKQHWFSMGIDPLTQKETNPKNSS